MKKKFGAPGSIESFGLRKEETMSESEKAMVVDLAIKSFMGNLEERDAAKKAMEDFFGMAQSDKDLLGWAAKDKHFSSAVSLCKQHATRDGNLNNLKRDLSAFGFKDQETVGNFLSIVLKYQ